MLSLFSRILACLSRTTREFASVEGPHLRLCLKNSSKSIGQYVLSFEAAQYSSFHPASTSKVQNQRSSPVGIKIQIGLKYIYFSIKIVCNLSLGGWVINNIFFSPMSFIRKSKAVTVPLAYNGKTSRTALARYTLKQPGEHNTDPNTWFAT